ncbi:2-keto-4-pentenoate hydratase [Paracraurococcus ruber]|uniref:Fumarylacetoacetase-like C-terminal domain-containing protein n=1 Tax=Paracraurococcus ruber TaxID=77675 RepID=A0ABS1CZK1_9PROT|nr:fumarylacetoacetate hydrolase family protein [Paracraurococcus ruber]MBK1659875.1 hypothetical protein [Paracraurococcus ruber]TDG28185.1 hydratase [Paracraurococcus ruber]
MTESALIDLLVAARREARQIPLPAALVPATPEAGYRVQGEVAARLGWEPLGWKIAGTTASVRARLGLAGPIYGRTFRRFAHPSPASLRHGDLLDPLVECEVFVTLARDLPAREHPWTWPEVVDAVATVHAGIEVAECRYPMAQLPPLPAILADGSASGRYVFGDPIPGWRAGLRDLAVTLEVDGTVRRRGLGTEVMGDPLVPLLWLAEERRRLGDGLRAGETVSTGSTTGMLPVRAGETVRANFGDAADVRIRFEAG